MSEFQGHTPEPWERTGANQLTIKGHGYFGRTIAVVHRQPDPCETHANADLMTAAPRLARERRELQAENRRLRRLVELLMAQASDPISSRGDEIALELDALGFGGAR